MSPLPDISLCMIIKNEAAFLGRCLESVKNIVSEMIILDTGSTDDSCRIARQYTDKIYTYQWIDDYADARNQAIAKATGRWILSLDADEILPQKGIEEIKQAIQDFSAWGYIMVQRNLLKDASGFAYDFVVNHNEYPEQKGYAGYVEARMVRLFQNRPEIRFEGRVHDQVAPSILRHKKAIKTLVLPIIHFGKALRQLSDLSKKQHYFREKGLFKIGESNFDVYATYEYARQCMELGLFDMAYPALMEVLKHESSWIHVPMNLAICARFLQKSDDAKHYFLMCIKLDTRYYYASTELASMYISEGNMDEALNWLKFSLAIKSDYWEALYYLGNYYWIKKDYPLAIVHYKQVIQHVPLHCRTLEGLGNTYFNLEQFEDACEYYHRAFSIFEEDWLNHKGSFNITDTERVRITYHLALCLFHLNRYALALKYFQTVATKSKNDVKAMYFIGRCFEGMRDYRKAIDWYRHLKLKAPELNQEILNRLNCIKSVIV